MFERKKGTGYEDIYEGFLVIRVIHDKRRLVNVPHIMGAFSTKEEAFKKIKEMKPDSISECHDKKIEALHFHSDKFNCPVTCALRKIKLCVDVDYGEDYICNLEIEEDNCAKNSQKIEEVTIVDGGTFY
jgi:hypothetical protein